VPISRAIYMTRSGRCYLLSASTLRRYSGAAPKAESRPEPISISPQARYPRSNSTSAPCLASRPAVLLDLGLDQAVDNLVGFWSKRREDVRITFDLDCESFDETLDSTIYRVFREGLNNALRHGKPTAVELKAKVDDENRVKVIVSDDGEGLPAAGGHFGYGLVGMRERVEDVGGTLSISNRSDGRGVTIVATLPLDVVESHVAEPVT
jgi:glucose-6-phosphate-specific signal transduction histidine kinase